MQIMFHTTLIETVNRNHVVTKQHGNQFSNVCETQQTWKLKESCQLNYKRYFKAIFYVLAQKCLYVLDYIF